MEKFNRTIRGYDPEEVNAFLDKVITQVEAMVNEIKQKDQEILRLQSLNAFDPILFTLPGIEME